MQYFYNFLYSPAGIFYVVIFIGILLFIYNEKNKKLDGFLSLTIFLFSIFFLGLRDIDSGRDTESYLYVFEHLNIFSTYWDKTFVFFTYLSSLVGDKYFYIVLNVLIQLLFVYIGAHLLNIKSKSIVLLAYISFMPGFDMLTNGLRQGLSSSLIMIVFILAYIKNKIPKISIFSALLMHKSVLYYLFYYFAEKLMKNKLTSRLFNILFVAIFSLIVLWHFIDYSSSLAELFSSILLPLNDSSFTVGGHLNKYLLNDSDNMLVGAYKYYFTFLALFLMSIFYVYKKYTHCWMENKGLLNFWFLTFFLTFFYALLWKSPYSYRFMYSMFLAGILVSTISIEIVNKRVYKLIYLLIVFISAVLVYGSNTFVNFKFIY